MEKWICTTCGTQFPSSTRPPEICPICSDERQYFGYQGQRWTTLTSMQREGFQNEFKEHELKVERVFGQQVSQLAEIHSLLATLPAEPMGLLSPRTP